MHQIEHEDQVGAEFALAQHGRLEKLLEGANLFGAVILGLTSAPLWPLVFAMIGFTLQRADHHIVFARKYGAEMGRGEAWALITCAALARAALWCGGAYGVGFLIARLASS